MLTILWVNNTGRVQLAWFVSAPYGVSWTHSCYYDQLAGQLIGPGCLHLHYCQLAGAMSQCMPVLSLWYLQQLSWAFLYSIWFLRRQEQRLDLLLKLDLEVLLCYSPTLLVKASHKVSPHEREGNRLHTFMRGKSLIGNKKKDHIIEMREIVIVIFSNNLLYQHISTKFLSSLKRKKKALIATLQSFQQTISSPSNTLK